MGLVKWLEKVGLLIVNPSDPTKIWVRDTNLEIVLDLDAGTFCGVSLGEPVERFKDLGPCPDYSQMECHCCTEDGCEVRPSGGSRSHNLGYDSEGFSISCSTDWRYDFLSVWLSESEMGAKPYRYALRCRGSDVVLGDAPDGATIERAFGVPNECIGEYDFETSEDSMRMHLKDRSASRPKTWWYETTYGSVVVWFDKNDRATHLGVWSVTPRWGSVVAD